MSAGIPADGRARAAVLIGPRQVDVRDVPLRDPTPRDVVVRTLYSGISAGTEMNVYRGQAPQWRTHRDPTTRLFSPSEQPDFSYPLVYGYASVGRVEAIGDDVPAGGLRIGDLVATSTPHASRSVVRATEVVVLPLLADPRVGVFSANLTTALNGVLDARPVIGDAVVVSGLGVVGLCLTQLIRRTGASIVVGVDALEDRRRAGRECGADVVLSPEDSPAETVRDLTGNRGADIVFEASGASPALAEAIRTVGYGGRVVVLSWYGGSFESLRLSAEFHHNRPRLISSQVGGLNPELGPLWSLERRRELATRLLGELDLLALVTHTMPIERAREAYALVDSGAPGLIQCVLSYSEVADSASKASHTG